LGTKTKIHFAEKISIRVHRKTFLPREREPKNVSTPFPPFDLRNILNEYLGEGLMEMSFNIVAKSFVEFDVYLSVFVISGDFIYFFW